LKKYISQHFIPMAQCLRDLRNIPCGGIVLLLEFLWANTAASQLTFVPEEEEGTTDHARDLSIPRHRDNDVFRRAQPASLSREVQRVSGIH
jgi:PAS domain-containing protein